MADSNDDVYDVEAIVNDRILKGRKQYLIKWLGYPSDQNTWEYEENIFCEDIKNEYEANKNKIKTAKKKREKTQPDKYVKRVTEEWAGIVKKVTGVSKTASGVLEVEYITYDDKKFSVSCEEMHIKAPIQLLEFYEENLAFPE